MDDYKPTPAIRTKEIVLGKPTLIFRTKILKGFTESFEITITIEKNCKMQLNLSKNNL